MPPRRAKKRLRPPPAGSGASIAPAIRQGAGGAGARELTGRRAVITGSSSGIGRAIAIELASAGAEVLIHARRSAGAAEATRAACAALGPGAHLLLADLADDEARGRFLERAWERLSTVDIWINNAGADILTGDGRKLDFGKKLERLWRVDVHAAVMLAREAGRRMRERGSGAIINIGWDQALAGMEGDSGELFAAVKGAVMAFSRSLALSLAPGVRVNCVAPGWIRTAWGEAAPREWQERALRETPLGRWGTPEDVARVVRFLVSPAAGFVTGQVIPVNGGAVRP